MLILLFIFLIIIPLTLRIAIDFFCLFLASPVGLTYDPKKAGQWAIVTGAGGGIGRGFALALARRGMNVCLIGRSLSALKSVAAEINILAPDTQTKIVQHEFTLDNKFEDALKNSLSPLLKNVGILVNNVGTAGTIPQFAIPFVDIQPSPLQFGRQLVATNIDSTILMTSIVAPSMVERKAGAIIFLGSACGIHSVWGAGTYCAAKSFVQFFAAAFRQEVKPHGIIVQTLTPSWVKSNLIPSVARQYLPFFIAPDAETVAEGSLRCLGLQDHTDGTLQHGIHNNILRICEKWLPTTALELLLKLMIQTVRKAEDFYVLKTQ